MATRLSGSSSPSGPVLPAGEAEEALAAALHDMAAPDTVAAVDAFVAALKQALKSLRTARGLTQGALAEAVGVSTSTVSRLEGDAATPIDLATLCEILQHLSVGLRCELQVDARSLEVAVRPPAEVAIEPHAADRLAIAEKLGAIRQRIEAIEQNLTGATDVALAGRKGYRRVPRVGARLPYGFYRPTAEPTQALQAAEAKIDEGLTIMRAAVAAAGKKAGSPR